VSRTQTRPGVSSTKVKTIHYGFLAVAQLGAVEKLVRETGLPQEKWSRG